MYNNYQATDYNIIVHNSAQTIHTRKASDSGFGFVGWHLYAFYGTTFTFNALKVITLWL